MTEEELVRLIDKRELMLEDIEELSARLRSRRLSAADERRFAQEIEDLNIEVLRIDEILVELEREKEKEEFGSQFFRDTGSRREVRQSSPGRSSSRRRLKKTEEPPLTSSGRRLRNTVRRDPDDDVRYEDELPEKPEGKSNHGYGTYFLPSSVRPYITSPGLKEIVSFYYKDKNRSIELYKRELKGISLDNNTLSIGVFAEKDKDVLYNTASINYVSTPKDNNRTDDLLKALDVVAKSDGENYKTLELFSLDVCNLYLELAGLDLLSKNVNTFTKELSESNGDSDVLLNIVKALRNIKVNYKLINEDGETSICENGNISISHDVIEVKDKSNKLFQSFREVLDGVGDKGLLSQFEIKGYKYTEASEPVMFNTIEKLVKETGIPFLDFVLRGINYRIYHLPNKGGVIEKVKYVYSS